MMHPVVVDSRGKFTISGTLATIYVNGVPVGRVRMGKYIGQKLP